MSKETCTKALQAHLAAELHLNHGSTGGESSTRQGKSESAGEAAVAAGLATAPHPVARPAEKLFSRILVAVDESDAAGQAVDFAGRLAAQWGSEIALLYVLDLDFLGTSEYYATQPELMDNLRIEGERLVDRVAARIPGGIACTREIRLGNPHRRIPAFAEEWNADLLVIGAHGRGRISQLLLGSTAEAAIRRCHCPVLVVGPRAVARNQAESTAGITDWPTATTA
jgi:nucleotide-binding universal stress UspA family protein